jgi:hypothetical protein
MAAKLPHATFWICLLFLDNGVANQQPRQVVGEGDIVRLRWFPKLTKSSSDRPPQFALGNRMTPINPPTATTIRMIPMRNPMERLWG